MYARKLLLATVLTIAFLTIGQSQSTHYVRIALPDSELHFASPLLDVDHIHYQEGKAIVEVPAEVLTRLDQKSIDYTLLVDDLTKFYQNQNRNLTLRSQEDNCDYRNHRTPRHFELGSMGGYLTLDELIEQMDKMHELYPDLIRKATPISDFSTYEGRPILWTEITGKGGNEKDKKGVLYTALHHAREPLSMQQMVYFMWYLLENYDQDAKIRKILNHTRLYFIPVVNPDGYAYNAEVAPQGGGMWRKNRRPLGNGEYGIDLNRNYGYKWGYSDVGSSSDPASELYRGAEAFSEPETQAIKWFCTQHDIYSALNYHSFGDYLIYPWGYEARNTDHDRHFESLAKSLSFEKRIIYGTSRETVLYNTNGDADDWMYGDRESKNRIYSMTPEVGPAEYGFWPRKDHIEMLCARELEQNIRMAMAPHGFVMMVPSNEPVIYSSNLKHRFYLYPVTLEDGVVQSSVTPLSDNIVDYQESFYFFGLENNEEYEMEIQLRPDMQDGEVVRFVMTLDNGVLTTSDTVTYIYSAVKEEIDVLSRETDIDSWVRSSQSANSWGSTSADYYSAPSSITDSPRGLYKTGTENYIVSSQSYRVPMEEEVFLTFKVKWDITFGKDYAQLSISTDGVNFTPLCGNLTTEKFGYNNEIIPAYTGVQEEWLTEKISLNGYKGNDVYFKWNLVSESADARDGIFVDDMKITYSQTITPAKDLLEEEGAYELFPNPATQTLFLRLPDEAHTFQIDQYEIHNQMGRIVQHGVVEPGLNTFETGHFSPGIYYIQLKTRNNQIMKARKFIILP